MAFNIHEDYWDRPFYGNDQANHIPRGVGRVLAAVVRFLLRIIFRFRMEGREIVDAFSGKATGAVLVAPHTSYLDVAFMFESVRPHGWVRLLARDSLFQAGGGFLGWAISHVGAFPIKRNSADRTALKRAARMLKNGEWVGIYPEGTRRGKGSEEPALHGGAALVARMGKAPIIPLGLENVADIKRKGQRVRFPRVTARFGKPISLQSFDFLPKDERLDGCIWYAMRQAFALSANCTPEEVDMAALFPKAKDYSAVFAEHPIAALDPATLPDYEKE